MLGLRRDLPDFSVRMGLATGDLVVGPASPLFWGPGVTRGCGLSYGADPTLIVTE